jgi:excisionase family DNA binding protein
MALEQAPAAAPEKDAYTVKEVADRLGVGTPAVYDMVAGRLIPSIRIGKGSIRIPIKAFESWLEKGSSQTPSR